MSLHEAILSIIDDMNEEIESCESKIGQDGVWLIKSYIRQLEIAVKASGSSEKELSHKMSPEEQHRLFIDKAREELRKSKESQTAREAVEEVSVLVVDGPSRGTIVTIPGNMPIGAKTHLPGGVYVLKEDNKLYMQK